MQIIRTHARISRSLHRPDAREQTRPSAMSDPLALAPPAVRVHHHLSLHLSSADDGAGPAHRRTEDRCAAHRPDRMGRCGAVLDSDLCRELRRWSGHRRAHGIPVRHQLGSLLQVRGRCDWPDPGDGGTVRVLPRIDLCRPARLWRAAPRTPRALPLRGRPARRHLALGLLHRLHERIHAVSHRPRHRPGRDALSRRLLGVSPEPLGSGPVRAHDDCLGRDRLVRHGQRRRVLCPPGTASRARTDISARWRHRRTGVERARGVPDRRPAGEARREAPAHRARGNGRPLRDRFDGRHRPHRPAQCERPGVSTIRSSCRAC